MSKLYNVQQWYWDSTNKSDRFISTIKYQVTFVLGRYIKRIHETDRTKNYPKGTYFKLISNVTTR